MKNLLNELMTEQVNPRTRNIDSMNSEQIIRLINAEDKLIADVIEQAVPSIAAAADYIVEAFTVGGRLFYVGAGTSGRLGVLDASECPPTFGTPPSMVQGIIAGGFQAIKNPVEGAEDSEEQGIQDMIESSIGKNDVVIGIAASGRTPYVLGAMKEASRRGAKVIGLTNNPNTPMMAIADHMIEAVVGPEVILGSTRMKSGTAQKLILNMLTTTSMIRIGKVYDNLMVDLNPSNEKLVYRAKRIIRMATKASAEEVDQAYAAAQGHVKTAIVMLLGKVDFIQAKELLAQTGGFVSQAVTLATTKSS